MISAFFPFIAAMFYGIGFVLIERTMHHFTVLSFLFLNGIMGLVVAVTVWLVKREAFLTGQEFDKATLLFFIGAALAPAAGWLLTIYSVKNASAVYAAMGEISYPLFTVLFAFLLFGVRGWGLSTLLGGALIMAGSFILVYGQMKVKTG